VHGRLTVRVPLFTRIHGAIKCRPGQRYLFPGENHASIGSSLRSLTYLQNLRMRLAEHELREGSTSVSQLGLSLAYASESVFSSAFKRTTGMAPKRYRSIFAKGQSIPNQDQARIEMLGPA
jgi:AraC-like DNA-binding protein